MSASVSSRTPTSSAGPPSERTSGARAKALPPDERRQSIIDAALPLVSANGAAVRTRDLANAAGVAEGTIFRVFADKDALIEACIDEVLSPETLRTSFEHIDSTLPIEDRLRSAVEVIQRRTERMFQLLNTLNLSRNSIRSRSKFSHEETQALARLFEPDADRFRLSPIECARILRGLAFMTAHPLFSEDETPDAAAVVSIALHGVAAPPPDGPPTEATAVTTGFSLTDDRSTIANEGVE
jgi:AcrR family transcriptional regulator